MPRSDRSPADPSAHSSARRRLEDQEPPIRGSAAARAERLGLSDDRKYFRRYASEAEPQRNKSARRKAEGVPHGLRQSRPTAHCSGRARVSTLIVAFILISVAASALVVVRGRAAEGRFAWSASLSRIFATRSALPLSPAPPTALTGIKTIKASGGDYATFTAAINDLNTNGVGSGGVTFNADAGFVSTEDTPAITATGSSSDKIVFQKSGAGANPIIKPTGTGGLIDFGICISGGDYITLDGIDITIASGSAVEYGYLIRNASATDGAQNDTIKNSAITLNKSNAGSIGVLQTVAAGAGGATPSSAAGANSTNKYYNLTIGNVYNGIQLTGNSAFPDLNTEIGIINGGTTTIGSSTNPIGGSSSAATGIRATSQSSVKIFNAEVQFVSTSSTADVIGIYVESGKGATNEVKNNKVHDISTTSTSSSIVLYGIRTDINSGNTASVFNNMIFGFSHGITTPSATQVGRALAVNVVGSGTVTCYFNSVRESLGTAASSTALYVAGGTITTKNNIFANFTASQTTAKHYAYFLSSGTITSDKNVVYIGSGTSGTNGFTGFSSATDRIALTDWQTATSQDAGSFATDPQFTSATNLHLTFSGSPASNAGTSIAGITTDIDGDKRTATPDIGADESNTAPTITAGGPLTRPQGTAAINSTIATVSDAETSAGSLTVTATTVPAGISVTNIVNTAGTVTANVSASCSAAIGNNTVVLTASDGTLSTNANLTLTVTANSAPTLSYANQSAASGGSLSFNPATGPSDNGSVSSIALQSQGTYTGTISVDNTGAISISNAAPVGTHTITIRATDNCSAITDAQFTLTVLPNISGSLFATQNTSKTIALLKNGASVSTTTTNGAGDYSFSGVSYSSGDVLTVFVSNDTVDNVKGATVTRGNSGNISSLNITQDTLTLRQDDSGPFTNANLASGNPGTDADLNAIYTTGASSLLTTKPGKALVILSGTNFTPGGNTFAGGNWTNNGTFTADAFTVDFNSSAGNQTISGNNDSNFSTLTIDNVPVNPTPSTNNIVSINVSTTHITTALFVTHGVFTQGETDTNDFSLITNAVTVATSATWRNFGKGDLTLSGDVSNAGTINFNASGTACGDTNDIAITSSNSSQRTWSGTGTFSMTDVAVDHQKVPGGLNPPLFILVNSGANNGNNTGWQFVDQCTSGTYTWIGGTVGANTDWNVGTNWNPTRGNLNNGDILIFDGMSTPTPFVTNIPTQTIATLKFINGAAANFSNASVPGATAHTLTIGGASSDSLVISSPSSLTLDGSPAITVLLTAGSKGDIQAGSGLTSGGQITLRGSAHRILASAADAITFADKAFFTTDTGFSGSPFGDGSSGGAPQSVEFLSGSFADFHAGGNPFGTSTPAVVTFDSGSTQTFFTNSAFSYDNRSYGNLILDGSQAYSGGAATHPLLCQNNLTILSGSSLSLSTAANGDLILWANLTDNNGSGGITHNNGTIKFQGAGTIPSPLIQHVTTAATLGGVLISQTNGSVQMDANLTIEGELKFNGSNDLLILNAKTLTLNGTVTGLGNLKGDGAATLNIGGTGPLGTLNLLNGFRTLSAMTMGRSTSGSVIFGNDMTVGASLTLTNGVVDMGAFTLTTNGSVARGNGYVIGNLQRFFGCNTSCTIPFDVGTANGYSPVSEVFHVNTDTTYNQTIKATAGKHPSIHNVSAHALQRYWTVGTPSPTIGSADITFNYLAADVPGAATESSFKLFRYAGSFTQIEPDTLNTSSHFATKNSVSTFSAWSLAEAGAVSPGTISFVNAPYADSETNSDHDFLITFRRSGGSDGAVSAHWATSPGTATAGSDYVEAFGDVGWADGDTADKISPVTIKGDTTYEANETVNITLSNPTGGATISGTNPTTLTITNDDIKSCPSSPFFVNSTDDNSDANAGDGDCKDSNGNCTLRAAIEEANQTPSSCGTIDINFDSSVFASPGPYEISLSNALPAIQHNVNINGPGASILRINGEDSKAFTINSGFTVTISGLTVTLAYASDDHGAAISNEGGTVTVNSCVLTENSADDDGGAIYSNRGSLTLNNCAVVSNDTLGGNGGGIYGCGNGSLIINSSTISGNSASNRGGGIFNDAGAQLSITNSTISSNDAVNGGGIYNEGSLKILNSTISGNTASDDGGGVYNDPGGSFTLANATITENHCDTGGNPGGDGGGIEAHGGISTSLRLRNTIVAGNFRGGAIFNLGTGPTPNNLAGNGGFAGSFNLIGPGSNGLNNDPPNHNNLLNIANAKLAPLGNYGGPTQTHALLIGSPAIDAGDNCVVGDSCSDDTYGSQLVSDQRERGFPRQVDGNGDNTATVDIGAFEVPGNTGAPAPDFEVNTTDDHDDGSCDPLSDGDCTLREAIKAANAKPDKNTIKFAIPTSDVGYVNAGTGIWTISPNSNLPAVIYPVKIDGFTQQPCSAPNPMPCSQPNDDPDCNDALLLIELEGSQVEDNIGIGLNIVAGSSTVTGLVVNRFIGYRSEGAGIRLAGNDGNTIVGNFIGTDATGTLAVDNSEEPIGNDIGVQIDNCASNTIGGAVTDSASAAARNLISANFDDGIQINGVNSSGNIIRGNFIGTDSSGTSIIDDSADNNPMGNGFGVEIYDGPNNIVGNSELAVATVPAALGAGNVISGNLLGVEISSGQIAGPTGNGVGKNYIGTDLTGTALLGNYGAGVEFCQDSHDNLLGGSTTDFRNVITGNGGNGVTVLKSARSGNAIRQNSIYNNGALGIDLGDDGPTANDSVDHTGPNNYQNFPENLSAMAFAGTGTISGTLRSPAGAYIIDFYRNESLPCLSPPCVGYLGASACDTSGYGEGEFYLGSKTVTIDSSGSVNFMSDPYPIGAGNDISATATRVETHDTSEFSLCVRVTATPRPNLSVNKSSPSPSLVVGQNSTYTITVTNNGAAAVTTAAVAEAIPAELDLISASGTNWSCPTPTGSDPVTCTFGSGTITASGGLSTIDVVVRPKSGTAGQGATNHYSVDPTGGANPPAANTCSGLDSPSPGCGAPVGPNRIVAAPTADLSITKTDSPHPVYEGNLLTYTITVNNGGPDDATNVTVNDTLPPDTTFVSAIPTQGTCSGTTTVTCNLGTIFAGGGTQRARKDSTSMAQSFDPAQPPPSGGGSAKVTIVVKPTHAAAGTTVSNTATVTADQFDPTTPNSATADTPVLAATCTTPPLGLISWYPGQGNANDIFGTHNGELVGDTSFVSGKVGQAFTFDGAGDYVNIPASAGFDLTSAITIDAWVKATKAEFDSMDQNAAIVTKGDSAWRLQRGPGSGGYGLRFGSNNNSGYHDLDGNIAVADGQWHHVAAVFDGTTKYLYVDGALDVFASVPGNFKTNVFDVRIGENAEATGRFWKGQIDEVEIVNSALSAGDVASIYNSSFVGKCHTSKIQFSGAPYSGNETDASSTITVTRIGVHDTTVTVHYETSDGSAAGGANCTAGVDYKSRSGTLTFNPNETQQTFTVPFCDDNVFEGNETVSLALSSVTGTGASLGTPGTAILTIIDNETAPNNVSVAVLPSSVLENGSTNLTYTFARTNTSGPLPVNFSASGTANSSNDYTVVSDPNVTFNGSTGTVTFGNGLSVVDVTIHPTPDTNPEADETVTLTVTSGGGYSAGSPSTATGTITNDDPTSISGNLNYADSANGVKNVIMTLTGPVGFMPRTATTDPNGNYSLTGIPTGNDYTLTPSKTGDANGIESYDASFVARFVAGLDTPSANQRIAGDSDSDNSLTSFDASFIARRVAGLNDTANVGTWKFVPNKRLYPSLIANQTAQNFTAILVGDVSGDWFASAARPDDTNTYATSSPVIDPSGPLMQRPAASAIAPAAGSVSVTLPTATGAPNASVSIPITVSDLTGFGVRSYDLQVTFDSTVLQPLATPYDTAGTLSSGMFITPNANNTGHLIISAFQSTDLSGAGILINLRFKVVGSIGQSTPLTFEDYTDPNSIFHPAFRFNAGDPSARTANGSLTVVGGTAANGNVSGQIVDSNGNPVEGAAVRMSGTQNRLTVTDAQGTYRFDNVETNGFYTVAPSRANFSFSPAQRSFSALGLHTNAAFNATLTSGFVNPLDTTEYFVRQQYLDFLGREPDEAGFNFWVNNIESCGENVQCREAKRIDTSAAFFLSIEFQQTGYLVYKTYKAAYGDLPNAPVPIRLSEFKPDTAEIGHGVVVNQAGWETVLENNKRAFVTEFVQRPRFTVAFPTTMTPMEFVDRLFTNAGVTPSANDRTAAINEFGSAATSSDAAARGQALRRAAENSALAQREFNAAFVLMQYFGYLRRDANSGPDPDFSGYNFWLDKLNAFDGNLSNADMVKAFLVSGEYRGRFPL